MRRIIDLDKGSVVSDVLFYTHLLDGSIAFEDIKDALSMCGHIKVRNMMAIPIYKSSYDPREKFWFTVCPQCIKSLK